MNSSDYPREATQPTERPLLRRVRNEAIFEIAFVAICFCLAIGLNVKIVLAVVLTCLKFAIPDFVTAFLIVKHDPSRAHGIAVAFLFLATGMARASQFAFIALMVTACLLVPMFAGWVGGQFFAIGLGTGFVCAFLFLASVFPLSLVAVLIAKTQNLKLSFASQLTKLRRMSEKKRRELPPNKQVKLDIFRSINVISIAAAAGLAVCSVSALFLMPKIGPIGLVFVLGAFVLPLLWIPFMATAIMPEEETN